MRKNRDITERPPGIIKQNETVSNAFHYEIQVPMNDFFTVSCEGKSKRSTERHHYYFILLLT